MARQVVLYFYRKLLSIKSPLCRLNYDYENREAPRCLQYSVRSGIV